MKFFRPQGAEKDKPDRLFVVTARHKAMILEAEGGAGQALEIVTKVNTLILAIAEIDIENKNPSNFRKIDMLI